MNIEIANRLVELRKKNGLSQEELASKLGLSRQAVSKWERAEASPDTDNLICLAKIYGVSLDEILKTDASVEEIAEDQTNQNEKIDEESPRSKKIRIIEAIITGSLTLVVTLVYVLIGVFFNDAGWKVGPWASMWTLYLLVPFAGSVCETIRTKKVSSFDLAFIMIVLTIFMCLGYYFDAWHPGWVCFLSLPVFFAISSSIDKITKAKGK